MIAPRAAQGLKSDDRRPLTSLGANVPVHASKGRVPVDASNGDSVHASSGYGLNSAWTRRAIARPVAWPAVLSKS